MHDTSTNLRDRRSKAATTIRPATRADAEYFPRLKDRTFRAMVAEQNGEPLGIAGYMYEENLLQGFSEQKEGIKPLTIVKLGQATLKMFATAKAPIYSKASKDYANSKKFLKWLGFSHLTKDIYIWKPE